MSIMEAIGSILIGLIILASAATGLYSAFGKNKLANTEQDLITLRMQTQQLFSGSADYTGLDNSTAIKTGIVPKSFIKGSDLKNTWGGTITLSPDTSNASFKVALANIPQDECTQLAKFQPDAWLSIAVNGNILASGSNVIDIVSNCSTSNTIVYEAR